MRHGNSMNKSYVIKAQCLLLSIFVSNDIWVAFADLDDPKCPHLAFLILKNEWVFFTKWNRFIQELFLSFCIVSELSIEFFDFDAKWKNRTHFLRSLFFSSIVYPSTVIVACGFWAIYHFDRELIFPRVVSEFIPDYINHASHTVILLTILLEFCCKKIVLIKPKKVVFAITYCYGLVYILWVLYLFYSRGEWIYPVLRELDWFSRIIFFAALQLIALLAVKVLYIVEEWKQNTFKSIYK